MASLLSGFPSSFFPDDDVPFGLESTSPFLLPGLEDDDLCLRQHFDTYPCEPIESHSDNTLYETWFRVDNRATSGRDAASPSNGTSSCSPASIVSPIETLPSLSPGSSSHSPFSASEPASPLTPFLSTSLSTSRSPLSPHSTFDLSDKPSSFGDSDESGRETSLSPPPSPPTARYSSSAGTKSPPTSSSSILPHLRAQASQSLEASPEAQKSAQSPSESSKRPRVTLKRRLATESPMDSHHDSTLSGYRATYTRGVKKVFNYSEEAVDEKDEEYIPEDDPPKSRKAKSAGGPRKRRKIEKIPCPELCGSTFTRKNDMVRHLNTTKKHQAAPTVHCQICALGLSRTDALRRHLEHEVCDTIITQRLKKARALAGLEVEEEEDEDSEIPQPNLHCDTAAIAATGKTAAKGKTAAATKSKSKSKRRKR